MLLYSHVAVKKVLQSLDKFDALSQNRIVLIVIRDMSCAAEASITIIDKIIVEIIAISDNRVNRKRPS